MQLHGEDEEDELVHEDGLVHVAPVRGSEEPPGAGGPAAAARWGMATSLPLPLHAAARSLSWDLWNCISQDARVQRPHSAMARPGGRRIHCKINGILQKSFYQRGFFLQNTAKRLKPTDIVEPATAIKAKGAGLGARRWKTGTS